MNLLRDTIIKLVKDFDIKNDNENGQNFLVDEYILEKEISEADLKPADVVLDMGAGFGSIESRVSRVCKIIAVEKEIKCYSYLIDKYEIDPNVEIINADVLNIVFPEFTKVVSNPPYNIADRVIEKLSHYEFESGIMILPKTLAEQLCHVENKTAFSAIQKLFMDFSVVVNVPKGAFYPEPRITSTMVRIKRKRNDVLQEIFRRREMTLRNAFINAMAAVHKKTKRESKEALSALPPELRSIQNRQVKSMNLDEITTVINQFK